MTLDSAIFSRHPGETDEAYAIRAKNLEQIFRDALNTTAGRRLLNLLVKHRNPMSPRFPGHDPYEASFLDGELSTVGTLVKRSAISPEDCMNLVSTPTNDH